MSASDLMEDMVLNRVELQNKKDMNAYDLICCCRCVVIIKGNSKIKPFQSKHVKINNLLTPLEDIIW